MASGSSSSTPVSNTPVDRLLNKGYSKPGEGKVVSKHGRMWVKDEYSRDNPGTNKVSRAFHYARGKGSKKKEIFTPMDPQRASKPGGKLTSSEKVKIRDHNAKLGEKQLDLAEAFFEKHGENFRRTTFAQAITEGSVLRLLTRALGAVRGASPEEVDHLKTQLKSLEKQKINLNNVDRTIGGTYRARTTLQLGYDPKSNASVRTYAQANSDKFQMMYGHAVLPQHNRKGFSSFLFAPNGDFSKAVSILTWDSASGNSLSGVEFFRTMQDYAALHDSIEEGWKDKIDMIIHHKRNKDKDLTPDAFKNIRPIFVIHPKSQAIRIFFDDFDPNTVNFANSGNGLILKVDDKRWKDVDTNHNKNMTEHKKKLDDPEQKIYGKNKENDTSFNKNKEVEDAKGKGLPSSDQEFFDEYPL